MKRHGELIKCNELKMYSNCTRCVNETLISQFREKLEPLMKVWLGNFLLGQKSIGQKSFYIFPLHVNPNNLDASRLFVVFLLRKLHPQLQFKPTWYSDRRITGFVATEFFCKAQPNRVSFNFTETIQPKPQYLQTTWDWAVPSYAYIRDSLVFVEQHTA